ncbi:MAG TPA: hypothetical protein VG847_01745 [Chitinophagaceae bacterium]|nr:hypothetical protein [Chitinophagaceae bacterium]
MEETNFVLLWKEQYQKIDESLALNKRILQETISRKAASALRSLIRIKALGIAGAIIWLLFLGFALYFAITHYSPAANYFIVSVAAIFLINVKALYDYAKHLAWVSAIDYDGSITEIQQKLAKLQLSIFRHTRVMFLQLPFWTTFYLSSKWFPYEAGAGYIIFQIVFTASFIYLAYWFYTNINIENADKKWVKNFTQGTGGKQVMKALEFYKEIEEFQK